MPMPERVTMALPPRVEVPLVDRLAVGAWLVTLIAGAWSLARVDPTYASWGPFAEVRYWLAAAFLGLTALAVATGPLPESRAGKGLGWMLVVVVLHAYLAASIAWSPDPAQGARIVWDLILLNVVLLAMLPLFRRGVEQRLDLLLWLTLWIALLYVLGGVSGQWTEDSWAAGRMAAFGGGSNVFARVMGMGIIASLYLWARARRVLWLWATPLFAYGVVMSGSRGGLLANVIAVGGYLWYLRSRVPLRVRTFGPPVLATLFLFAVQGQAILEVWRWRFIELTLETAYVSERDQIFKAAFRSFMEHPVGGLGLDGYRQLAGWSYPHNIVLHVLAEGGMVGGAFLLVAAALLLRRAKERVSSAQAAILALAGLYFVASMFSGGLYDARFVWALVLLYMLPAAAATPDASEPTPVA